jgi:hypothetical protein
MSATLSPRAMAFVIGTVIASCVAVIVMVAA